MIKKIVNFITRDVWRIKTDKLPKTRSFFLKQLRIVLIAFRGFNEDLCLLRASALTFYSLLSIVPVLAMFFGIAKGFGMEKMLQEKIMSIQGYNQEVLIKVSEFAHSMLENTKGGVVAGVGIIVLFWSVMKVLGNIESSFNDIWEIKKQRSWSRKFSDYLSIMLIAPIMFILSSSITGYVRTMVEYIMENMEALNFFEPVIFFLLRFLPYILVWLLLAFIYIVMPNTKVKFQSALVAGIIAGTLFEVAQIVYFSFQVGVAQYNAIYGSFAALPLFLVWMQTSWMIVLFGAEISFANQNVSRYEFEAEAKDINNRFKKEISVFIMLKVIQRFKEVEEAYTASEIARQFSIPIRLVRQIIFELTECRMLVELRKETNKEVSYHPGKDINEISIQDVVLAMDNRGSADIPIRETERLEIIKKSFGEFEIELRNSKSNVLLRDMI